MKKNEQPQEMTYAAAMAELESILAKMNEPDPDIDSLAQQVTRAGELIRFCRERLLKAEAEVTEALNGQEEGARQE
ncbi:MAG TPA: exodeoxyribonuclease VII small subunit [Candidatus Tidjanibacter faecipullorum]|uniref:Exodeoxyribonuclease VII small subunit n=1 Tax=Candidatus Tidjanibacter faecipullorum TaxID=2838766 RepID=A0A9D2ILR9_9BACT|nr:exodeoxyribonuclease VII small subunit [Candidatus Tidjanibacter faecipullorum]